MAKPDLVTLPYGKVQGTPSSTFPSVISFQGIPYAASTSGANRWRPPQPPSSWSGVRLCDRPGPVCPQKAPPGFFMNESSEDCLSVNVLTPASDSAEKLPVYVWIYGGRFAFGTGADPQYDGSYLASQGIVFVSMNYRVGMLGFLAHPKLSKESEFGSGNYGILDQVYALQWVRNHIHLFGGDPSRVTIGGQSAGGASTALHLYCPLSRGLFHGAIVESAHRYPRDPLISGLAPSYRTLDKAEAQGRSLVAEKVGDKDDIEAMRQLPAEELLFANGRNEDQWGTPPIFRPVLDGHIFPLTYNESLVRGIQADVPLLTGHNWDEGGTYNDPEFSAEDLELCGQEKFGEALYPRFKDLYPVESTPLEAWNAMARDHTRTTLSLFVDEWHRHASSTVWLYHFAQPPPAIPRSTPGPPLHPAAKGYTYSKGPFGAGVFHGAELFYAFNNLFNFPERPWTDEDRQAGLETSGYWLQFIKHGDPNGKGLPSWKGIDKSEHDVSTVMRLGRGTGPFNLADKQGKVELAIEYFRSQVAW